MNGHDRLEALLVAWEQETICPEEVEELAMLLENREHRAALVRFFHGHATISAFLREEALAASQTDSHAIVAEVKANPIALILSGAMLLDYLGEKPAADRIRRAVTAVLKQGKMLTADLGGTASTGELTRAIVNEV